MRSRVQAARQRIVSARAYPPLQKMQDRATPVPKRYTNTTKKATLAECAILNIGSAKACRFRFQHRVISFGGAAAFLSRKALRRIFWGIAGLGVGYAQNRIEKLPVLRQR